MDALLLNKRYQTEKTLGQGRLSTVYQAQDLQTNQRVALKVLQPHLRAQPVVVQRFLREMAAVQRIDHEAIIRIFEVIETPEHLALVMEFAPGENLKSWLLSHGPMPPERVLKLAKTLLEAIDQAHIRGIVHRDLSLTNIILDESNNDRFEVIGFGLARVDELVGLTMHTRVLGTLETMAPECILGQPVTTQADIFSIGAMLYELLTARPLHDGRMNSGLAFAANPNYLDAVQSNLKNILNDDFPELFHAITRALAPDPALRFATAAQFKRALATDYDHTIWTALEEKTSQPCPKCKRPLIQGMNHCVYCKHAISRLIERPGEGNYIVQILSPHMAFKRDVWFEANTESVTLSEQHVRDLHEILFTYQDTRRVFHAGPNDNAPPYILFDELTLEDAKRVEKLLKERNIPHEIAPANRRRRASILSTQALASSQVHVITPFEMRESEPPNVKRTLKVLNFTAVIFFMAALTPILFGIHELLLTSPFMLAIGAVALGLKPVAKQGVKQYATNKEIFKTLAEAEKQNAPLSIARVSSRALRRHHHAVIDNALPESASQTLLSLADPTLQQEFHDVLELTVRMFRLGNVPTLALREKLEPMLDHTGTILQRLATLRPNKSANTRSKKQTTPELFSAISLHDVLIEESTDIHQTERLIQKRTELFEQMTTNDAITHETNLLQGHLLRVRATLLDLQAQFTTTQIPSLEHIAHEIDDLKIQFEAEREVLELLEKP